MIAMLNTERQTDPEKHLERAHLFLSQAVQMVLDSEYCELSISLTHHTHQAHTQNLPKRRSIRLKNVRLNFHEGYLINLKDLTAPWSLYNRYSVLYQQGQHADRVHLGELDHFLHEWCFTVW